MNAKGCNEWFCPFVCLSNNQYFTQNIYIGGIDSLQPTTPLMKKLSQSVDKWTKVFITTKIIHYNLSVSIRESLEIAGQKDKTNSPHSSHSQTTQSQWENTSTSSGGLRLK